MPDERPKAYVTTVGHAHGLRLAARQLAADGLIDRAIAAIHRADSVGAVVDPTLYHERAQAMHEDLEVLRAVRDLARLGGPR